MREAAWYARGVESGPASQHDLLRAFVAGRDAPCPGCGYNVRDLTGGVCPECGEPLRLTLSLVEPRLGPFVAGLIGLAAGMGFCGLVLVWGLIESASGEDLLPLVSGLVVESGAAVAWVRRRGAIRRLPMGKRTSLLLGCWGLTALFAGWFFTMVS